MQGHSRSAEFLSNKLVEQGISGVVYPGLQEHPQYELMGKQLNPDYGYGGMITLDVGSRERAVELAKKLQEQKFGLFAVSLGTQHGLIACRSYRVVHLTFVIPGF
jgi:methionine-gamma-lyase